MSTRRVAVADPALVARVIAHVPLHYSGGPDPGLDRPSHVRSGSSLAWVPGGLAIIQDDANFLAVLDSGGSAVRAITLPAGTGGLRQFDDARGNKKDRLDLEACVSLERGAGTMLLAFGSGSSRRREGVILVDRWESDPPEVTLADAAPLYARLRAELEFAGSELNIEGAIQAGTRLRLFSRGNGAPRGELLPVNATCELDLDSLLHYLRDPAHAAVPAPIDVIQYQLGSIGGVPLGFTDAAEWGDSVLYSATAEASPDATRDGPVNGSAIGVIGADGATRWACLSDGTNRAARLKVEGLATMPGFPSRLFAVLDRDDPGAAAELCTVELMGPWQDAGQASSGTSAGRRAPR